MNELITYVYFKLFLINGFKHQILYIHDFLEKRIISGTKKTTTFPTLSFHSWNGKFVRALPVNVLFTLQSAIRITIWELLSLACALSTFIPMKHNSLLYCPPYKYISTMPYILCNSNKQLHTKCNNNDNSAAFISNSFFIISKKPQSFQKHKCVNFLFCSVVLKKYMNALCGMHIIKLLHSSIHLNWLFHVYYDHSQNNFRPFFCIHFISFCYYIHSLLKLLTANMKTRLSLFFSNFFLFLCHYFMHCNPFQLRLLCNSMRQLPFIIERKWGRWSGLKSEWSESTTSQTSTVKICIFIKSLFQWMKVKGEMSHFELSTILVVKRITARKSLLLPLFFELLMER